MLKTAKPTTASRLRRGDEITVTNDDLRFRSDMDVQGMIARNVFGSALLVGGGVHKATVLSVEDNVRDLATGQSIVVLELLVWQFDAEIVLDLPADATVMKAIER